MNSSLHARYLFAEAFKEIVRFLGCLFVGSLVGAILGAFAAGIASLLAGEAPELGISFGFPIGMATGFFNCCIAYWAVRNYDFYDIFKKQLAFVLCTAFLLALIPVLGAVLSWFGSILGFWVGIVVLMRGNRSKEQDDAPE